MHNGGATRRQRRWHWLVPQVCEAWVQKSVLVVVQPGRLEYTPRKLRVGCGACVDVIDGAMPGLHRQPPELLNGRDAEP